MSDTEHNFLIDPNHPARPTERSPEVVAHTVDLHRDELMDWWGGADQTERPIDLVLQDVRTAIINNHSVYEIVRFLDISGWEGDDDLYNLIRGIVRSTLLIVRDQFVRDWVMQSAIRFPASEGARIEWAEYGVEFVGNVLAVIKSEARAILKYGGVHLGLPNVSVPAEAVTKILLEETPALTSRKKIRSR